MDDEKTGHAESMAEKPERGDRHGSVSSTEADAEDDHPHHKTDGGSSDLRQQVHETDEDKETRETHGEPDIDHDEIEGVVPGHDLDVELGKVPPPPLSTLYQLGSHFTL
jgi:hypothetical protein